MIEKKGKKKGGKIEALRKADSQKSSRLESVCYVVRLKQNYMVRTFHS